MDKPIRMTFATAAVLDALDRGSRYGFDLIDLTGIRSGTVYPLLRRLEGAGMVKATWEAVAVARTSHRPPRKYYRLTAQARPILDEARRRFPALVHMAPSPTPADQGGRSG